MSDEMAVIDNGGTEETNTESIEKVDTDVERSLEAKEVHKDHTELKHSDEPSNSQEETDPIEDSKLEIVEDNLEKQESVPSTEPNVGSNITEPKNTEPEPITELDTKALDAVSETQVADQKIFDEDVNETHPQIPELQVHVETDVKTPEMEVDENIEDKIEFETEMLKRDTGDSCKEGEKLEDIIAEVNKGIKRRASDAFGDENDEEFKGFDTFEDIKTEVYGRVVARLEAEVSAAIKNFTPVRNVIATPTASKRPRTDTDGSRPSSAMSSKSDENTDSVPSSPAQRRRATIDMSSPALRLPLERGWKRELVYRAALDSHSRKHGDIYYYTPLGKKLRSTREVSEQLAGTGLTLENFSFFKEPLGVDDPDKEIIRDAKLMRRVESPVCSAPPAVEGKRTPKPKPPKGASPEPVALTSPPAKIKVKSVGSRLSGSIPVPAAAPEPRKLPKKPQPQQPAPTTPSNADNNNTAAWKKPREHASPPPAPRGGSPVPPPALAARTPLAPAATDLQVTQAVRRRAVQPCSMACGRGAVPSLACAACLCLYHPACAGCPAAPPAPFLCKNCRKSSSPPLDPPPLVQKSGVAASNVPAPVPRRVPVPLPVPVPVPVPAKVPKQDKRVLLRMKAAGGTEGERVWSVSGGAGGQGTAPAQGAAGGQGAVRGGQGGAALPQSLALLNGRRFIVVPRTLYPDDKRRGRLANGAPPPAPAAAPPNSPRRRRARSDVTLDADHFAPFYSAAQERNYNVVVQIFQYLGMRDLARCARVCKLWRQLAAAPALWRHVRMKNSHVSDWAGLCAALKRNGTKRLDLRKMLLPQNDAEFWDQFAEHIGTVDTIERIELCRCPARAVEAVCRAVPGLRSLAALAIRDALLDPAPLAALSRLHELRLKSMTGLSLTRDLSHLAALTSLQHLSLTSIKALGWCACEVVSALPALESLELGECTFRADFPAALSRLTRLRRLRLERGTAHAASPPTLRALAALPHLTSLELVNVDVKVGFDDALAECKNIQRLLIIPTYVSQSATTNKQVLSGVLRLKETLTHLMWGVTIELLRVTELFIDQCKQAGDAKRRELGECIPVLKPVPGCRLPPDHPHVAGPPQVEILPLPTLQRLLSAQLPNTKLKLLRIPFHATWRQSLADFQ